MSTEDPSAAAMPSPLPQRFGPADVVDVFVYVVVLNLAAEYAPQVIAESFTMSLLTAVLLKAVLEVVVALKRRIRWRIAVARRPIGRILGFVLLWLLLVGSKVVVLELEALLLGDSVSLGGFISVTALILVMMLARSAVRRLLAQPDPVTGRG